jgi:DNA-directed RNA polymerase subunit RPC12/RpoP
VQIAARGRGWGAARSALSVGIAPVEEGVRVTVGEQRWLDAAASLAITGLGALIQPRSLLWRIDDIARDVGKLTLDDQVWEAVEHYAESSGARLGLAEKQLAVTCPYCGVGNPVGQGKCSACGAGLAEVQPISCPKCGFVLVKTARFCSRCGRALPRY